QRSSHDSPKTLDRKGPVDGKSKDTGGVLQRCGLSFSNQCLFQLGKPRPSLRTNFDDWRAVQKRTADVFLNVQLCNRESVGIHQVALRKHDDSLLNSE